MQCVGPDFLTAGGKPGEVRGKGFFAIAFLLFQPGWKEVALRPGLAAQLQVGPALRC